MYKIAVLSVLFILSPVLQISAQNSELKYMMRLSENWEIENDLPTKVLLISLQGVANREAPRLYFIYPQNWDFTFTEPLYKYYQSSRKMAFQEIKSHEEALEALSKYVNGYVVWDKSVRTSLIVAFTFAGLTQSVIVSEELIPVVERYGIKQKEDFRGRFTGLSDYEIYQWAYDQYWEQCNKDYLVYLGGQWGKIMKPGIADFGILKRSFFTDASTDPSDSLEYQFANQLFSEMKPMSLVMGWHSYKKDSEAQHVTLASSYALRVEGLHTLPNMSFNHQIPVSPGYRFKNNHN